MSGKVPTLPAQRLDGKLEDHIQTMAPKRSSCKMCSYLQLKHRGENLPGDPPKVSIVKRMCSKCKVNLCSIHFHAYHAKNGDESEEDDDNEVEKCEMVGV